LTSGIAKTKIIEDRNNLENRIRIWLDLHSVCYILANFNYVCPLIPLWFVDYLHCYSENCFGVCSNWGINGLSEIFCKFQHTKLGLNSLRVCLLRTLNYSIEVNTSNNFINMNANFLNIRIRVNVLIYFHFSLSEFLLQRPTLS
jgi:hypothetical protein